MALIVRRPDCVDTLTQDDIKAHVQGYADKGVSSGQASTGQTPEHNSEILSESPEGCDIRARLRVATDLGEVYEVRRHAPQAFELLLEGVSPIPHAGASTSAEERGLHEPAEWREMRELAT